MFTAIYSDRVFRTRIPSSRLLIVAMSFFHTTILATIFFSLIQCTTSSSLDSAVKARWPTSVRSSLLLEASEFVSDEGGPSSPLFWSYVDKALSESREKDEDPTQLPLRIAKPLLSPLTYDVLRIALAARAHSAAIEVHRQLAIKSATAAGIPSNELGDLWVDVFFGDQKNAAVCQGGNCDIEAIVSAAQAHLIDSGMNRATLSKITTFQWDHMYPSATEELKLKAEEQAPTVILYADLGSALSTPHILKLHTSLRSMAEQGRVRAVFRHWFRSNGRSSDSNNLSDASTITWLSGYGVGLDVKSLEYKVIDDRVKASDAASEGGAAELSESARSSLSSFMALDNTLGAILGSDPLAALTDAAHKGNLNNTASGTASASSAGKTSISAGVNWAMLSARRPGREKSLLKARAQAEAALGGAGASSAPSVLSDVKLETWETGSLGLQAASYVMDAAARANRGEPGADPLQALVTAVSNFPSMAPFLSRIPVSENVKKEIETNNRFVQPGASVMTVNGIQVDPTSPIFNIFTLFNIFRAEAHVVAQLDTLPLSPEDRRRVQELAIPGKKAIHATGPGGETQGEEDESASVVRVRSLVEPHEAYRMPESSGIWAKSGHNHSFIEFLNDIEKDEAYASWSNQLQVLLQPAWQLPQIKRNLYTAVIFLDLSEIESMRTLMLTTQFLAMTIPIRFGFVLVPPVGSSGNLDEPLLLPAKDDEDVPASGLQLALLTAAIRVRYGAEASKQLLLKFSSRWSEDIRASSGISSEDRQESMRAIMESTTLLSLKSAVECYASISKNIDGGSLQIYASEAEAALQDKGGHLRRAVLTSSGWARHLGTPIPGVLMNGKPMKGLNIQQEMMQLLQPDMQLLQGLVYSNQLDDNVAPSVYHAFMGKATRLSATHTATMRKALGSAFKTNTNTYGLPGGGLVVNRWHPAVFADASTQTFLPLSAPEAKPLIESSAFIHAPGTGDEVKPVTITLFDDFGTPHGLASALSIMDIVVPSSSDSSSKALASQTTRLGFLYIPTVLTPASSNGMGGLGPSRNRGPSTSRSVVRLGDAVAVAISLAAGRKPELVKVWADEVAPVVKLIIESATDALKLRNASNDLQLVGCAGCHVEAVASFVTFLSTRLEANSATIKKKSADKLLALIKTLINQDSASSNEKKAMNDVLSSLYEAADVARRIISTVVPGARSVITDAGGSSLRVRALSANGRVLGISTPSAEREMSSNSVCGSDDEAVEDNNFINNLAACVSGDDASVISTHERTNRGMGVAALLKSCEFPGVDPDDVTADWMSGVVMSAASAVGASLTIESGNFGGRAQGRMALRTDLLTSNFTSFTTTSANKKANADSVGFFVSAIIDPASEDAQRYAPLLLMMRDRLGATVRVHLNPGRGHADLPVKSFFRYVLPPEIGLPEDLPPSSPITSSEQLWHPRAIFAWLPPSLVLTLKLYVPEPWNVQATKAIHDTDNLKFPPMLTDVIPVEFSVKDLLAAGQCIDSTKSSMSFPNGLQLQLLAKDAAGGVSNRISDTLVMQNLGYYQLKAQPGVWSLALAEGRSADLYDVVVPLGGAKSGSSIGYNVGYSGDGSDLYPVKTLDVIVRDFTGPIFQLQVKKKPGLEGQQLLVSASKEEESKKSDSMLGKISNFFSNPSKTNDTKKNDEYHADGRPIVHVFSLASGHVYERFLNIMMLAAVKRSQSVHLHFWLVENFLSPSFKDSCPAMAKALGCDISFVTYKWPNWLRQQTEKQRIIWGYKILFLDVLFPLNVSKVIYIDADQVVRSDLAELWNHDLQGAPYAFTPFCTSRKETLGYQFWREGYWKDHLRGKSYHISALYVVDLALFRKAAYGDQLRAVYDTLSRDPASLSNLDQDLPAYSIHQIPIHSLPQDWLWCESWCSDESKSASKTIDLCNNPRFKEPKLDMAKRVISGPLFPESWVELDAEVSRIIESSKQEANGKTPLLDNEHEL